MARNWAHPSSSWASRNGTFRSLKAKAGCASRSAALTRFGSGNSTVGWRVHVQSPQELSGLRFPFFVLLVVVNREWPPHLPYSSLQPLEAAPRADAHNGFHHDAIVREPVAAVGDCVVERGVVRPVGGVLPLGRPSEDHIFAGAT